MNTAAIEERPSGRSSRQPNYLASVPYVAPFVVFFVLLLSSDFLHSLFGEWEYPVRVTTLALVLWVFSRNVIDFRVRNLGLAGHRAARGRSRAGDIWLFRGARARALVRTRIIIVCKHKAAFRQRS